MTRRDRDQRAGQAVPPGHRAERLHDQRSRGPDIRAGRAERRGQDHAAAAARRAGRADRGPGHRARRTPRQDPGYLAEIGFLAQEIPLYRRLTAQDHIGIGAHLNPRWDGESVRARLGRPADPAGPAGGHAVRRPAGPGRAGAHPGQAAAGAAARRAASRARPAGPAELPRRAGRGGGGRGADHRAVLAPDRGHRAGLRPPDPAGRFPGAAVRRHRRAARRAPGPGRPAQGHDGDRAGAHHRAGGHHRAADHAAGPAERPGDRPGLGRRGNEPGGDSARLHERRTAPAHGAGPRPPACRR